MRFPLRASNKVNFKYRSNRISQTPKTSGIHTDGPNVQQTSDSILPIRRLCFFESTSISTMSLPAAKAQHFSEVKTKGLLAWKPWTSSESWRQLRHSGGIGFKLLLLWWWENITMGFPPQKKHMHSWPIWIVILLQPTFESFKCIPNSRATHLIETDWSFIQGEFSHQKTKHGPIWAILLL